MIKVSTEDYKLGLQSFEAPNEQEIIARKLNFLADGGDFLYLRKGEDVGAVEVVLECFNLLQQAAELAPDFAPWVEDAAKMLATIVGGVVTVSAISVSINKAWKFGLDELEKFRENLARTKNLLRRDDTRKEIAAREQAMKTTSFPIPKDIRIICVRDSENEKAISLFRLLGARIRHRPKSVPSGSHRFYLNDKRLALFFRQDKAFLGVTGHDPFMEQKLKLGFLVEWELCGPDVEE